MSLKAGKTKEQLDAVLTAADPAIIADGGSFGPSAWGATVQNPNAVILFLGWESSKVRYSC